MKKIIVLLFLSIILSGCTNKNIVVPPTDETREVGTKNSIEQKPSQPIPQPEAPAEIIPPIEDNIELDNTPKTENPAEQEPTQPILQPEAPTEIIPPTGNKTGAVDYTRAGDFVGENKIVRGKVVSVYYSAKSDTTFLNFCSNYQGCPFSSVVFSSDKNNFGNLNQYEGKTVEISGLIKTYKGSAEIILKNSSQINIVK